MPPLYWRYKSGEAGSRENMIFPSRSFNLPSLMIPQKGAGRAKDDEKMKKFFGVLALLGLVVAFGAVGGIEAGSIGLGAGFLLSMASVGLFGLGSYLAGWMR